MRSSRPLWTRRPPSVGHGPGSRCYLCTCTARARRRRRPMQHLAAGRNKPSTAYAASLLEFTCCFLSRLQYILHSRGGKKKLLSGREPRDPSSTRVFKLWYASACARASPASPRLPSLVFDLACRVKVTRTQHRHSHPSSWPRWYHLPRCRGQ